jgi:hypothetical protein
MQIFVQNKQGKAKPHIHFLKPSVRTSTSVSHPEGAAIPLLHGNDMFLV